MSYQLTPQLMVGFDAEWQHYSQAFHKLVIDMKGLPLPPLYLKWKDSYLLAIGAEYKVTPCFILRTGYSYTSDHVTPGGGLFPYLAATAGNAHNLTAGFGYKWKNFLIDVGWSHHLDVEGKTKKSFVGRDYDNSTTGFGDNLCVITFSWLYN